MKEIILSEFKRDNRSHDTKEEQIDLWIVAIRGLTAFAISFGIIFGILCGVIAGVKIGHKVAPLKQYVVKK